jgi:hypothetical protein
MKRAMLVLALMLPIPFAALPLISVGFAFGGADDGPSLRAEVVVLPSDSTEHTQLAYHEGQPDPLCTDDSVGF